MAVITIIVIFGIQITVFEFLLKEWKRTHLDLCRNELFSLRDDLREYFYINNLDMSSRIYKNTRDLINAHLQYTDMFSIESLAAYSRFAAKYPNDYKEIEREINAMFYTSDKELSKFINEIRIKSVEHIKRYAINRSVKLWAFSHVLNLAKLLSTKLGNFYAKNTITFILNTQKIEEASFQRYIAGNSKYSMA